MDERDGRKWRLYWCETDDHDEDWFIVARSEDEAASWHEDAEGYDEGDATAELVCVLPAALQAQHTEPGWPSDETLTGCGGEYLPNVPQDGNNALRREMDSGSRVVRFGDQVYAEGDIVGNTTAGLGDRDEAS